MRILWAGAAILGMAFGVTACGSNGTSSAPSASSSPPAAAGGSAGPVPACVAGTWRSTSVTAAGGVLGNGASGTVNGGQGVTMTIAGNGATKVGFGSMQPVSFAITANGANVKGQYSYGGTASGTLRFPGGAVPSASGTATPATATSGTPGQTGTWQPAGDVTWDDLRLTLKVTEPVDQTLLNDARVPSVTGSQTSQAGNAVDLRPVLGQGTYTCEDGTLTVRPQAGPGTVTWVFQRG